MDVLHCGLFHLFYKMNVRACVCVYVSMCATQSMHVVQQKLPTFCHCFDVEQPRFSGNDL